MQKQQQEYRFARSQKLPSNKMLQNVPELERRLYRQALKELDEARNWMVTLGRKTAGEKIASFLLMIARHSDPTITHDRGLVHFELPLTRADIVDFLGLTVDTVSRQLCRLRGDKVIHIEGNRQITIPDLGCLEACADD